MGAGRARAARRSAPCRTDDDAGRDDARLQINNQRSRTSSQGGTTPDSAAELRTIREELHAPAEEKAKVLKQVTRREATLRQRQGDQARKRAPWSARG